MLQDKIKNDIKDAMRAKDSIRLEVLRGLTALFTNEMLAKSVEKLSDEDVLALIRRSVKQRKDSILQFEKGGRPELAEKERAELVILESFLPKMMDQAEIEKFVSAKLATSPVDKTKLGQFVGVIMKELKGKADGSDVKIVVEKLVV